MFKKINLYVVVQFICMGMLLYIYGFFCNSYLILFQLLAVLLALWSFLQFKRGNFSIGPLPKQESELIKSGPYQLIRNPMYLSLLIYFGVFLIEDFNWFGLNFYLWLLLTLILKLHFEESLLKQKFPLQSAYFSETKRLIPYLY